MLRYLSPFQILVDYSASSRTEKDKNLALAALRRRGRVCAIALRCFDEDMVKNPHGAESPISRAGKFRILSRPLHMCRFHYHGELVFLATLLSGFAPCLLRLTLRGVVRSCLSLLSSGPRRTCFDPRGFAPRNFVLSEFAAHVFVCVISCWM